MPKQELLEAVVDHLQAHGLGDQSLRAIAEAVGSSHRMLVYHFGSREGLLAAVVDEVERRERVATEQAMAGADPDEALRRLWSALSKPSRAAEERLFYELAGQAVQGRPGTEALRRRLVDPWLDLGEALGAELGVAPVEARTVTRLDVAVIRGLLLDLLATGDRRGVHATFDRYLAWRAAAAADRLAGT